MRNKYGAVKTEVDGITFASKREANRYAQLKLLERGKRIAHLTLQPRFECVVAGKKICTYVADFQYFEEMPCGKGVLVVEDVKGVRTPLYKLKKKLVEALYGIKIVEV